MALLIARSTFASPLWSRKLEGKINTFDQEAPGDRTIYETQSIVYSDWQCFS